MYRAYLAKASGLVFLHSGLFDMYKHALLANAPRTTETDENGPAKDKERERERERLNMKFVVGFAVVLKMKMVGVCVSVCAEARAPRISLGN